MQKTIVCIRRSIVTLTALCLTAVLLLLGASLGEFRVRCEEIPQQVLRLHVLANSDAPADQALKLKVRDAILQESGALFAGAGSKEEAMALVQGHAAELEAAACRTLRENGCDDPVTVALEQTFFRTRTYGDVTLPAGTYDALQVKIGKAEGHNWWCVLFPVLCLPAAQGLSVEDVLSEEQQAVVSQRGYDVRFAVVECYEWLFGR